MGTILFLLFFILIFFLSLVFWVIERVGRIFGLSSRKKTVFEPTNDTSTSPPPAQRKKIIAEDEGEYVDFEEL